MSPIVSIIMGSTSDLPVMKKAADYLNSMQIPFEMLALSAHRTPEEVAEFARNAAPRGVKVIIAGAGMSAALPGVIAAITRYLREHLESEISLSVLSEEFHMNPQYISQLFKNEIGVGFLTYLTSIRMEKAKSLLLTTSLSVAEIAEETGYNDYRVFTKVFKKTAGITPSQFRRGVMGTGSVAR